MNLNSLPLPKPTGFDPLKVIVQFYWNGITKSEYISGPYCPGEGHLQRPSDRPATKRDRELFAPQYKAYKAHLDQCRIGTSLTGLFPQSPAKVSNLYKAGIYNIEQLAEINQNILDRHKEISGDDKIAAQRHLEYLRQQKEIDARDQTIMMQADRIKELESKLNIEDNKPQRPIRKKP